ncbi:MAG: AAA family ATPase [Planctomycetota bacterium]|jgi:replication-associated recombination protein RarA
MLSERYRPQDWSDFVGQPIIDDIRAACADEWLFDGCGERWLLESEGYSGCGKTSAAYVAARQLGCDDFAIERIDSRAVTIADLRELSNRMHYYGIGGNGRRAFIIDEIQHLNCDCRRYLLGLLENLPSHVIVFGTTTSVEWADDVDGLFSRWRRFRFKKPGAPEIAELLERIAREQGLAVPEGFRFLSYVQGKCGIELRGNNVRDCIDQLPDALRRYKGNGRAKSAA